VTAQHLAVLGLHTDGVNVDSTLVKAAYKTKVLTEHPDKGGSSEGFRKIQAAYDYLKLNGYNIKHFSTVAP
jgi:curved DNA-binding protein CbpA